MSKLRLPTNTLELIRSPFPAFLAVAVARPPRRGGAGSYPESSSRPADSVGGRLAILAYITDELAISRILDHLGLTSPPQERPPPTRELVRVPLDEEGREIQAG